MVKFDCLLSHTCLNRIQLHIRIGYFAQEVPDMDTNQRVIDYIRDVAEYIPIRDGKISATMMLERFLFDSAMQYAPIAKLSV